MQKLNRRIPVRLHCLLACVYFLMLPLTIAVNSSGASFLKLVSIPVGGYFLAWILLFRQKLKINVIHLLLFLYTIDLFTTMFTKPSANMVVVLFGYVLNAGLFFCLSAVEYSEREMKTFSSVQVILLAVLVVITLWNDAQYAERTTLTIFGQASDPNYFVGFFIFPMAVTIERIFRSKYRLWYFLLACVAGYTILLSGSRGGLLAVLALVLASAVLYPKGPLRKGATLALMIGVMALLWLAVRPFLPENILERFSIEAVVETRGTYRMDIWESMLREVADSTQTFLAGRGVGSEHDVFLNGRLENEVAHNQYIQALYDQGILGLLLFLLLVGACILRCAKRRPAVAVAMIGMMALGVSLSFNASTKSLWNIIVYAAFAFPDGKREDALEGD